MKSCVLFYFYTLTGGRPMKREGFAFTDIVSGLPVHRYRDAFGNLWLADNGSWSLFRVRGNTPRIS